MSRYSERDPTRWANAVRYLHTQLSDRERAALRSAFGAGRDQSDFQFTIGLRIRNLLRQGGFHGDGLRVPELDAVWADLARAVADVAPDAPTEPAES